MKKTKLFPVIYGILSAMISFLAVFFICRRFRLHISLAILISGICAILFYILSYFRAHASIEIKRITHDNHLTSQDLAQITGLKSTDFPIVNGKLQLILPKRKWARILVQLQQYEKDNNN